MTSDLSAFAEYVRGMEPDMIPDTGTDIESAFAKASSMLSSNKILRSRLLVFVSDGESMNEKYPSFGNGEFFIWGVGTSSGSSIYYKDDTTGNAGFVTTDGKLVPYEDQGTLVKSILNESYLRKLASKNSGEYINISSSPEKAEKIISKISSMEKNSNKVLQSMSRKDSYIYFLFPAFILMLLDITLLEWLAQRYTNPKSI
jgi:Ca-activated chloride channel family protein